MGTETWDVPFEAYDGEEPFIFVSYSHRDKEIVCPDLTALHGMGFRIWYDEGIDPGFEWAAEVAKALDQCTQFLVFISENATGSRNVRNEINYALNHDKHFLAIHISSTKLPPALELRMGDIQAIMSHRMNRDLYTKKIVAALSKIDDVELRDPNPDPDPRRSADTQGVIPPAELWPTINRIGSLHRAKDWAAIRDVGATAAASLIQNADGSFANCQTLSELGA